MIIAALTLAAAVEGMRPGEMRYVPLPAPDGSVVEDRTWKSNRTVWTAENGAAFDGSAMWFHGGGHADGAHNGVWLLDLDSLTWSRPFLNQPLTLPPIDPPTGSGCWRPALGPEATHTYNFIDHRRNGRILLWTAYASFNALSPSPPCNFSGPGVKGWWEYDPAANQWTALATPQTEAAGTSVWSGYVPQKFVAWAEGPDGSVDLFGDTQWCRLTGTAIGDCWGQNKTPWWARHVPGVGLVVVTRQAVEVYRDRALTSYYPLTREQGREADLAGIEPFGRELAWWPGGSVVRYLNLDTGVWREETATGGALPDLTDAKTQKATHTDQSPLSKWRYLPARGVFIGVPTPDGIWLYRPGTAVEAPPEPVATLPCGDQPGVLVEADNAVVAGCTAGTTRLVGKEPTKFGVARTRPGVQNTTFRDLTLTLGDEALLGDNIACIRAQGTGLTLENVRCVYPFGDGVLSSTLSGDWSLSSVEIVGSGGGRNEGHGLYHCSGECEAGSGALSISTSTILDCRYRTAANGEAVKSRGARLRVASSVIGGVSIDSRCDKVISMAQGVTEGLVTDSVLLVPPRADSDVPIGVGQEAYCADGSRVAKRKPDGDRLCIPDGQPVPDGYEVRVAHPAGTLTIRDSLLICDRRRYVAGEDRGPGPCRFEVRGPYTLAVVNTKVVGFRPVDDKAFIRTAAGGRVTFSGVQFCATRAECGIPDWPEVPRL